MVYSHQNTSQMMSVDHKLVVNMTRRIGMFSAPVKQLQPQFFRQYCLVRVLQQVGITLSVVAVGSSMCLLADGEAEAATFSFTKIADTSTLAPNSSSNFTGFSNPAIDSGSIAFRGSATDQVGIYTTDVNGALNVVADRNTAIPNGSGNFSGFSDPSIDGENVAFSTGFRGGVYTSVGGSLQTVVDTSTTVPGVRSFVAFYSPAFDNGEVAFRSEYYTAAPSARPFTGILTNADGALTKVAEYYPGPGNPCAGGRFASLGNPAIDNGTVAFAPNYCTSSTATPLPAIFTRSDGSLQIAVDSNTAIPGGTGNFTRFGTPAIDDGDLAFRGEGASQRGIFTKIDDELQVVADLNTAIPGENVNFTDFGNPALNNKNVVFIGSSPEQQGIYTNIEDALLHQILASGDTLDDKVISSLSLGSEALSEEQIAFLATFTDGSQGIYVASVPEASSAAGVLVIGAMGAVGVLKRQRH